LVISAAVLLLAPETGTAQLWGATQKTEDDPAASPHSAAAGRSMVRGPRKGCFPGECAGRRRGRR